MSLMHSDVMTWNNIVSHQCTGLCTAFKFGVVQMSCPDVMFVLTYVAVALSYSLIRRFFFFVLGSDRQSSVHASSFDQNTAPVGKTVSNKTTTCIWFILSQKVRHRRNLPKKVCLVLI